MRKFIQAVILAAAVTSVCNAADVVSYPEKTPAFTVDVPSGWTATHEHGAVKISAQGADAVFVLQYVQNVKDDSTAEVALSELATLQGKQFSLEDMKVVRPTSATLMGDCKGFVSECSGKSAHGTDTSWQTLLFSPKDNDYYLVTCLWTSGDAEKTAADRMALFKSLKAIR